MRRVPALADAAIWRGVTGVYDVSPDFRPLIGQTPGVAGLYVVCGFSGMGFKISPAIGLVVVGASARRPGEDRGHLRHSTRSVSDGGSGPIKAEWEYGDEEPAAYT